MNYIGRLVQKEVKETDNILDIGCGIMQATTDILYNSCSTKRKLADKFNLKMETSQKGNLICKSILGMDIWEPYLKETSKRYPVISLNTGELFHFIDNSFDVVLCLDLLEHLKLEEAIKTIDEMIRITRNKVIIFTPSKFETNEQNKSNTWGLGENPYQKHQCFLEPDNLKALGFKLQFPEPSKNTFGVYTK